MVRPGSSWCKGTAGSFALANRRGRPRLIGAGTTATELGLAPRRTGMQANPLWVHGAPRALLGPAGAIPQSNWAHHLSRDTLWDHTGRSMRLISSSALHHLPLPPSLPVPSDLAKIARPPRRAPGRRLPPFKHLPSFPGTVCANGRVRWMERRPAAYRRTLTKPDNFTTRDIPRRTRL